MTTLASSSPALRVLLALPPVAALALYAHLLPAMAREWADFPSLSHGFAIPFIAAYLVWSRRERLVQAPVEPSLWGLPILLGGLGGLVAGTHGQEPFVARISLPVILLGLTLLVGGAKILREAWMGIVYLIFMIPMPWATLKLLIYRSQLLDAAVSAEALGALGVPVYREGILLHLPNITLEVADVCSSIPAIAALLALGVAYASLKQRHRGAQAALIVATVPFAVASNIIRITATAAGVYYIGPDIVLGSVFHQFTGTVNFLFTLMLLLLLEESIHAYVGRRR